MLWSNWQGAIWRGAMLVLLFWSGLAWTQPPAQPLTPEPGERFMVVHENGKATRCRVKESWQLPDRRMAHLLEAVDTGELITIVDETAPGHAPGDPHMKPKAMPKRIFTWGQGQRKPPEGSPLPPHFRVDSGLVFRNDTLPPHGVQIVDNPTSTDRVGVEQASGITVVTRPDDGVTILDKSPMVKQGTGLFDRLFAKKDRASEVVLPSGNQVLEYKSPMIGSSSRAPYGPTVVNGPMPTIIDQTPVIQITAGGANPTGPAIVNGPPASQPGGASRFPPSIVNCGDESATTLRDPAANKPWRPGEKLQSWLQGKPSPSMMKVDPTLPPSSQALKNGQPIQPAAAQQLVIDQPPVPTKPLPGATSQPIALTPSQPIASPQPIVPTPSQPIVPTPSQPIMPTPIANPQPIVPTPSQPIMPTPIASPQPIVNTQPTLPAPSPSGPPMVPAPGQPTPSTRPNVVPQTSLFPAKPSVPTSPAAPVGSVPSVANSVPADPKQENGVKTTETPPRKSWRPGEKLYEWLHGRPTPSPAKTEPAKPSEVKLAETSSAKKTEDFLDQQNKSAEKKLAQKIESITNTPFSTAMATTPLPGALMPDSKKPDTSPLVIPKNERDILPAAQPKDEGVKPVSAPTPEKRDMWGVAQSDKIVPPGKSVLDSAVKPVEVVKLPPAPERRHDPLVQPDRLTPNDPRVKPVVAAPVAMVPPLQQPESQPWPLGTQSVLAARGGLQGPIYVPVPTVTVPQPTHPPAPPAPNVPEPPQLNAFVNAFSAPPAPKTAPPLPQMAPAMASYGNPMLQQQQLAQQQMWQQQMMQQQMMQQPMMQQPMMAQQPPMQQPMMPYGYPMNPYMPMQQPNPYGPQYRSPMVSQGPLTNGSRQYAGPQAPNPFGSQPVMPTNYAPMNYPPTMVPQQQPMMMPQQQPMMMPQQPMMPVTYQQPLPAPQPALPQQATMAQQVEQLIKVMRESPYPAQREWAAQSLMSFEWRAHPQIVPALLQSASQDPAASVRAGCVGCLGRMQAAVEPVFAALHSLRNDIDPRVRQEVEQAFIRLGQTAMAPH